jgi:hypothetical protein
MWQPSGQPPRRRWWPTQNDPLIAARRFGEAAQRGRLGAAAIDQDGLALKPGSNALRQRRGECNARQDGISMHGRAYHADIHPKIIPIASRQQYIQIKNNKINSCNYLYFYLSVNMTNKFL